MEYLYTVENLKMILGPSKDPGIALSDCHICKNLPDSVYRANPALQRSPGTLPTEASRLIEFITIKNSWQILKCPACGRLYTDEYHYGYPVGGSEDAYVISRIEYCDALELLKGIKAKKLIKDGARWLVSW